MLKQPLQGRFFRAISATFDSAVAINGASEQTFSENTASFILQNTSDNAVGIYPLWIRIILAGATTNGTNLNVVAQIDSIQRYSSGGSALTAIQANGAATAAVAPIGKAYFGAITAANASAAPMKLTGGHVVINSSAPAAGDTYIFDFNDFTEIPQVPAPKSLTSFGALWIPPQGSLQINLYSASQTGAPTGYIDCAWVERA